MSADPADKPVYNVRNPFLARLKRKYDLSSADAPKHTCHYELDLSGSGLEYLPGDSLAIQATNDPDLVQELLRVLGFSGEEKVPHPKGGEASLSELLTSYYLITEPDKKLLTALVEKAGGHGELARLLQPDHKEALRDYLWGRHVIDLVEEHPEGTFTPAEFCGLLKKLNVRLYSISSSQKAVGEEVHLTVATVRYQSHGKQRGGVATTFLTRVTEETPIPVFVTPGKGFRLPEPEQDTPIILCGPGTGIAPFRAFLQERKVTQARGDAWLFFGEVSERMCFFYREEFEGYLADGTLQRLDCAWSRDQAEKVYVQHKILQAGAEFWSWLQRGAIFYVCGDANRMAIDVDSALHRVIETHGGMSAEAAGAYVEQMKKEKRYRRDVY